VTLSAARADEPSSETFVLLVSCVLVVRPSRSPCVTTPGPLHAAGGDYIFGPRHGTLELRHADDLQDPAHGRLLGSLHWRQVLFGGHKCTMVCMPAQKIEALNLRRARGIPIRGRRPVEIDSRMLTGKIKRAGRATRSQGFRPRTRCDAGAAIRLPGVRELLEKGAR